ncbi:hypothetical protein KBC89_04290 [Candidatus Woesebacteria bacterium]|nr:hypothetical protein [Candidatus Woesebacteria bacterium]
MSQKKQQKSFLESISEELLSKYGRLDTILSHAPSRGTYHEKILRDVIRNYLPSTFSTGEGFIINKKSEVSTQLDVLIVDNFDPRSFGYKDNDFYIASDIAVACFGEVKSYCKKNEFLTSFHNLIKAKALLCEPQARVTSFVFCYDAYASAESFSKWVDYAIKKIGVSQGYKVWHFPEYVFCLKKNIMLERRKINGGFQYFHATSKNNKSNIIQLKIIQDLIQCVTDGCSRVRLLQGFKAIDTPLDQKTVSKILSRSF